MIIKLIHVQTGSIQDKEKIKKRCRRIRISASLLHVLNKQDFEYAETYITSGYRADPFVQ